MSTGRSNRSGFFAVVVVAVILAAFVLLFVTLKNAIDNKVYVCATFQNAEGEWREPDDEPFDADPCDVKPDAKKTTKPAVPKPRTTRK